MMMMESPATTGNYGTLLEMSGAGAGAGNSAVAAVATTTTLPSSTMTTTGSTTVISEKVQRALQVRTDTPAMKAALEALTSLQAATTTTATTTTGVPAAAAAMLATVGVVDSRSVRVAIERDALQQARLLQSELHGLVQTVQALRQGVAHVATLARQVRQATEWPVITAETKHSMIMPTTMSKVEEERLDNSIATTTAAATADADAMGESRPPLFTTPTADSHSWAAEETALAQQLADAFQRRNVARKRYVTLQSFLERFDLSQQDARILDHYNFEDVSANLTADTRPIVNGTAFLRALERVHIIRSALTQSMGGTTSGTSMLATTSAELLDSHHSEHGLASASALRMMEALATRQQRAHERLYHWLQQTLQQQQQQQQQTRDSKPIHDSWDTGSDDILDELLQHPFIKRGLFTLRHVPAFYTHTLELIATSRRAQTTRRFLLALTSGFADVAPIEMKAHDPVAYVGDMLAFAFRAFSTEADLLQNLLDYRPPEDETVKTEPTPPVLNDDAVETHSTLDNNMTISTHDILSISISGLARPLKSRILQVVTSLTRRPTAADSHVHTFSNTHDDDDDNDDDDAFEEFGEESVLFRTRIVHLYELCGLLLFYQAAIAKGTAKLESVNGPETQTTTGINDTQSDLNPLLQCVSECLHETTQAYEATVRVYSATLNQLASITGDTEAQHAHHLLMQLTEVRLHSPGFVSGVQQSTQYSSYQLILTFEWVTETVLQAALQSSTTSLDDVLTLKESLRSTEKAGLQPTTVADLNEAMSLKESTLIDSLVEFEVAKVYDLCGFSTLVGAYTSWKLVNDGNPMSTYPGLSQEQVEESMRDFYASLYSPPLPSLETVVKDPLLRGKARRQIAAYVATLYKELYQSIQTMGGFDDLSFLVHTPDQVATLFSA